VATALAPNAPAAGRDRTPAWGASDGMGAGDDGSDRGHGPRDPGAPTNHTGCTAPVDTTGNLRSSGMRGRITEPTARAPSVELCSQMGDWCGRWPTPTQRRSGVRLKVRSPQLRKMAAKKKTAWCRHGIVFLVDAGLPMGEPPKWRAETFWGCGAGGVL
jgi:hypothetical protein